MVENKDGKFIVSGEIRFKGASQTEYHQYVNIDLVDETGEKIDFKKVFYYPRHVRRGSRPYRAEFSATFNDAPPPGTVIRLAIVK